MDMDFQTKFDSLHSEIVSALCSIRASPKGLPPFIRFVYKSGTCLHFTEGKQIILDGETPAQERAGFEIAVREKTDNHV